MRHKPDLQVKSTLRYSMKIEEATCQKKKRDFEKQRCQVDEMKKNEEKLNLHSLHSQSGGNGRYHTA